MEVCVFHELGYHLTNHQKDLTTIQKLFLTYAYPLYHKMREETIEEAETPGTYKTPNFREKYQRMVNEKKKGKGPMKRKEKINLN